MAVNLVRNYTREQAHQLLNSSFAQFLADRGVVALERQRERGPAGARGLPRATWSATWATSTSTGACSSEAKRLREEDRRGRERERVEADPGGRRPACGPAR